MDFFSSIPFQFYIQRIPEGIVNAAWLTTASVFLGLGVGLILALARLSSVRLLSTFSRVVVDVGRSVPLLVLIFVVYFSLLGSGLIVDPLIAGLIAVGGNLGFYMAELFRSGLEAIPRGLIEAGYALGMSSATVRLRITLPIAVRVMLPTIGQYAVGTLINTSYVSVIGGREMTNVARGVIDTYFATELWWVLAVTYFMLAFLERRLRIQF